MLDRRSNHPSQIKGSSPHFPGKKCCSKAGSAAVVVG